MVLTQDGTKFDRHGQRIPEPWRGVRYQASKRVFRAASEIYSHLARTNLFAICETYTRNAAPSRRHDTPRNGTSGSRESASSHVSRRRLRVRHASSDPSSPSAQNHSIQAITTKVRVFHPWLWLRRRIPLCFARGPGRKAPPPATRAVHRRTRTPRDERKQWNVSRRTGPTSKHSKRVEQSTTAGGRGVLRCAEARGEVARDFLSSAQIQLVQVEHGPIERGVSLDGCPEFRQFCADHSNARASFIGGRR